MLTQQISKTLLTSKPRESPILNDVIQLSVASDVSDLRVGLRIVLKNRLTRKSLFFASSFFI